MIDNTITGATQIQVARFIVQETGTFDPMFNRPYAVDTTGGALENAIRRLDEAPGNIYGSALSGVGSMLLKPVTDVDPSRNSIYIPHGWHERRLRFVLEVHVTTRTGSVSIYHFQGFSSHMGITPSGGMDEQMRFYINSFVRVSRFAQPGPTGLTYRDVVQESAQVLNGKLLYQDHQEVHRLRPCDMFSGIQTAHLHKGAYGSITDTRTTTSRGTDSFGSKRSNNLPTNYLANIMNGYRDATSLAEFGQGVDSILSRAQSVTTSSEPAPEENPVLRAFASVQGVRQTVEFSMNDLLTVDPNAGRNLTYHPISTQGYNQLSAAGRGAHWGSTDRETVIAAQLANSLPALMMEKFISRLTFTATNVMGGGYVLCEPTEVWSLTNADMRPFVDALMVRIRDDVLFDITHGNQEVYDIIANIDLFGQTTLEISLYGRQHVLYSVPSFGDGLLAPVYTRNLTQFERLSNDVEILTNHIRESGHLTAAINTAV